jgi:N-acetylmuramoyl-L-alanine amidase
MVLWDLAQSQYLSESSKLAETIQENLNALLKIESRGVKQAPFKVLMGATIAGGARRESASSPTPRKRRGSRTAPNRDKIAQAIIDSVAAFKERVDKQLGLP